MNHGGHTPSDPEDGQKAGGHGKHGVLLMIACCVPMVVVIVLIGLKVL